MRKLCTLSIPLIALLATVDPTSAQSPTVRRPALSPYLQLLRPQTTPLPNYQSFVRPRIEAQRNRVQQNQINNRLQREITAQQQQFSSFSDGGVRPTGRGGAGGFMNTLHYYPANVGNGMRR